MLGGRAPRIAIAVVTTLLLLSPPLTGGAHAAGQLHFKCEGTVWQPSGSNLQCKGIATGVLVDTSDGIVCIPTCSFELGDETAYSETCLAGEPPTLGAYEGTAFLVDPAGVPHGLGYFARRIGAYVVFTFSRPAVAGEATWIVSPFGVPTCSAPGLAGILLVGRIY